MELSIDCRNKHWSQCFNWILISSAGSPSVCLATVVLAALDSRAASTTVAGQTEGQPADEIKIRLKHCDQYLFLQYMLNCWVPPYPNQFLIFGFFNWKGLNFYQAIRNFILDEIIYFFKHSLTSLPPCWINQFRGWSKYPNIEAYFVSGFFICPHAASRP